MVDATNDITTRPLSNHVGGWARSKTWVPRPHTVSSRKGGYSREARTAFAPVESERLTPLNNPKALSTPGPSAANAFVYFVLSYAGKCPASTVLTRCGECATRPRN